MNNESESWFLHNDDIVNNQHAGVQYGHESRGKKGQKEHGGNPNLVGTDSFGRTPIFHALTDKLSDRIELLLEAGADINFRNKSIGRGTPVLNAMSRFEPKIAYKLLLLGADYRIKSDSNYDVAAKVATLKVRLNKDSEQYAWVLKIEQWLAERNVSLPAVNEKGHLLSNELPGVRQKMIEARHRRWERHKAEAEKNKK